MRVLVTGAAGMIGRKLVDRLIRDGVLSGRRITALDLHDIVPPAAGGGGIAVTAIPVTSPRPAPLRRWSRRGPT